MKKLTLIFSLIGTLSLGPVGLADDGLLDFSSGIEAEAGMTGPGATKSFSISLTNQNTTDDVSSVSAIFTNSDYGFLGGVFPGIGGDCSDTSIVSGSSCNLMIEHSPTSIGDSDSFLNLSYNPATDTLGSSHVFEALIDGHSENLEVSGCSALAPVYTSHDVSNMGLNTSRVVNVSGANFSIATQLTLSSGVATNVQVISPNSLQFTANAPGTSGSADITIQTECGSIVEVNALAYSSPADGFVDLRTAAGFTLADPQFTSNGVNGITMDATFGIQVDVSATNWNKFLKFNGVCDTVSQGFEIVIYRSGTNSRFMTSLINQATAVEPWPGTAAWQRQYIGFWNNGANVNSVWGTQGGEGGSTWNQTIPNVTFEAGKYYKYVFQAAGQNGNLIEVFEVDSSFNELNQLMTQTSNKTATSAASVCAGIIPYSAGVSDYYVTAVRSF